MRKHTRFMALALVVVMIISLLAGMILSALIIAFAMALIFL